MRWTSVPFCWRKPLCAREDCSSSSGRLPPADKGQNGAMQRGSDHVQRSFACSTGAFVVSISDGTWFGQGKNVHSISACEAHFLLGSSARLCSALTIRKMKLSLAFELSHQSHHLQHIFSYRRLYPEQHQTSVLSRKKNSSSARKSFQDEYGEEAIRQDSARLKNTQQTHTQSGRHSASVLSLSLTCTFRRQKPKWMLRLAVTSGA